MAKKTVATEQKEIKLDFIRMCQERNERFKREEKAKEYIEEVNRRREQRFEKIRTVVCTSMFVVTAIIIVLIMLAIPSENTQSEQKLESIEDIEGRIYFMQGELQGNHVVLEDGNVHEVDNANYTSEPMQVTVSLNDNGTEETKDDVVINIR